MIACPRCSKENQDHYKFCLGCGAELPREAEQPKGGFSSATPPGGSPAVGAPPPAPSPPQFGGAAGVAPPGPALGAPPPVAPPLGGSAAPGAPPPAFGAPPMSPPSAPPVASPPVAAPPPAAPPAVAPPAAPAPSSPPMGGGFGGPSPAPAAGLPAAGLPAAGLPAAGPSAPSASAGNVVCPQCSTSNNQSFKFCGSCGFPLQNVAAAPAAPASPVVPSASGTGRGTLVLIRPDGTEGESVAVDGNTVVGRESMPQFASDSYLSPRHATFHFGPNGVRVRDESSLNGIYLRIERDVPTELAHESIFRIGQEIIRFERVPPSERAADGVEAMGSPREGLIGRICLVTGRETYGNCYAIPADGLHLGRERGDILFPDDGYVSGLHARIHADEGGKIFLTDVGSSNGTFIRIEGEHAVPSGCMLLMGQQLFRFEY